MSTASPATPELGTELTLRGILLGILITLVFTAANVYFGLKAGLTFATSIPAAWCRPASASSSRPSCSRPIWRSTSGSRAARKAARPATT